MLAPRADGDDAGLAQVITGVGQTGDHGLVAFRGIGVGQYVRRRGLSRTVRRARAEHERLRWRHREVQAAGGRAAEGVDHVDPDRLGQRRAGIELQGHGDVVRDIAFANETVVDGELDRVRVPIDIVGAGIARVRVVAVHVEGIAGHGASRVDERHRVTRSVLFNIVQVGYAAGVIEADAIEHREGIEAVERVLGNAIVVDVTQQIQVAREATIRRSSRRDAIVEDDVLETHERRRAA